MKAGMLSAAAVLVAGLGLVCEAAAAERGVAPMADRPIEMAQQMPQLQPALPPSLAPRTNRRARARSPVDPLAPPPLPADPMAKQDEAIRRALQDPALRAGLPRNAPIAPPSDTAPPATGLPTQAERLDRDRDGRITRDEYFRGRDRVPPASLTTDTRQRMLQQRLDTQFKQLDQNRDGAITPNELQANPNSRF